MSINYRLKNEFKDTVIHQFVTIDDDALQAAIDWMKENFDPDEIFTQEQLEKWAEGNGYVKE